MGPMLRVTIAIPVYNDWPAVFQLVPLLDVALKAEAPNVSARILLLDDGSASTPGPEWDSARLAAIEQVDVLVMRRNLGHQRAIAVGLSYIEANFPCDAIVVMDGDGEDSPGDVPTLLKRFQEEGGAKAIFAQRARRTEKLTFRIFYKLYKGAHWLLTGQKVLVGNFSVVPFVLLKKLVVVSDLWNHYAAALFKARLPVAMVPLARGHRLAGESRMNFVSLVVHGLSAMSVHGERIGVRLLAGTGVSVAVVTLILLGLLSYRIGANYEFPRWMVGASVALLVILFQALGLALVFAFTVLSGRDHASFLPVRDYGFFVDKLTPLVPPFISPLDSSRPSSAAEEGAEATDKAPR
jgi:polyisoprenyl-phosphate glycosyltransferase